MILKELSLHLQKRLKENISEESRTEIIYIRSMILDHIYNSLTDKENEFSKIMMEAGPDIFIYDSNWKLFYNNTLSLRLEIKELKELLSINKKREIPSEWQSISDILN
jgi:hypothetical protein